jgi:hypothetical protein
MTFVALELTFAEAGLLAGALALAEVDHAQELALRGIAKRLAGAITEAELTEALEAPPGEHA